MGTTGTAKSAGSASPRYRGLAAALFSSTQQKVLGLLFGAPERSFYATEVIALAGGGSGAVQRELARLSESGLLTVTRIGSQKHYQANPASPLFGELRAIVRKTVGLADPLREALAPLRDQIHLAFVFGSVARKSDTAASDIDLVVVTDTLSYADIFGVLEPLVAILGRPVNPTVYTSAQFARRRRENAAFLKRVLEHSPIWLIGSEDDLRA